MECILMEVSGGGGEGDTSREDKEVANRPGF